VSSRGRCNATVVEVACGTMADGFPRGSRVVEASARRGDL
jgi:hypothetical protein